MTQAAGDQYVAHTGLEIPRHIDYPEQGLKDVEDPTREGEELDPNDEPIDLTAEDPLLASAEQQPSESEESDANQLAAGFDGEAEVEVGEPDPDK